MSSKGKTQYANEIPREIKSVIRALDDDIRLAIIISLMKNTKMSFAELKKSLDIQSSSLSHHLSLLQDGGLVNNFLELKGKSHSYYTTTGLTKSILESLFDIIIRYQKVGFDTDRYRVGEQKEADKPFLKISDLSGFFFLFSSLLSGYRKFESPSSFGYTQHVSPDIKGT